MGKSARIKAERRAVEASASSTTRRTGGPTPVFWLVVIALVVGGIVATVATRPDDAERTRAAAADRVPVFGAVRVTGAELPRWTGDARDAAVGRQVPTLRATSFEGGHRTVDPLDGTARVYVVVAHWCPHCNIEVPRIVEWAKEHPTPRGVQVIAVSTAVDKRQPNFPPAAWLAEAAWPFPALVDDEVGSAAAALGTEGFPFLVFADARGRVVRRFSGEMPIREFAQELTSLRADAT
ncbi:MAG: Redoxin [Thermoleophilia bacterium]|nr:Redoxin [Thermoleophilia bacterium]